MKSVTWDGKDLAAVQSLLPHGSYEVDRDWNLTITGIPVIPGMSVTLEDDGSVKVSCGSDVVTSREDLIDTLTGRVKDQYGEALARLAEM